MKPYDRKLDCEQAGLVSELVKKKMLGHHQAFSFVGELSALAQRNHRFNERCCNEDVSDERVERASKRLKERIKELCAEYCVPIERISFEDPGDPRAGSGLKVGVKARGKHGETRLWYL